MTVVGDGQAAIDTALASERSSAPFDVVLTDIQMPLRDGYQVAAELRRAGFRGRIVALTAHAMATDRQRCLDAGCHDYDTKPIDRRRLLGVLQRQVREATNERTHRSGPSGDAAG